MYQRFLRNSDYLGLVTQEALQQLIRGNESRIEQAEMSAEMSLIEYLSENFEIEDTLMRGKAIIDYNNQITYPVHSHFILDDVYYKVTKSIAGNLRPSTSVFWKEREDIVETKDINTYSQQLTYQPKELVLFRGAVYECVEGNGTEFNNIQLPGITGWEQAEVQHWTNIPYEAWKVVEYNNKFYTLMNLDGYDYLKNPHESDNWGLIGDYDESINTYELSEHEYVVLEGNVFYPVTNVNSDVPAVGVNIYPEDPRSLNVKKHMLQLALYELHKLISPNNVSLMRIKDYEISIQWLRDASRLKLNPQIPRKVSQEDGKPVLDWQIATFQRDYNPNENPWQV